VADRAISTVVDVSLALLLVSASVLLVSTQLVGGDADSEQHRADRAAETVASTTMVTRYSIAAVRSDPTFDTAAVSADASYTRRVHGSPAELLGSAAVTNATFDGGLWATPGRVSPTGPAFEAAVGARLYGRMTDSQSDIRVTALWRPYENASIEGVASAGGYPPLDTDVHSVTMTVPSGMEPVDAGPGATYDQWGEAIADSVVEGYFPAATTQLTLEQRGLERQMTVSRYRRFETVLGSGADIAAPTAPGSPLNRSTADASAANAELRAELADRIATELEDTFDSPAEVGEAVRVSEVRITVQTW
jgi:hypothetical protein